MTIYVKNVNDNEPQFLVDIFSVNFTENKSPGSERTVIVGTVDRDDDEVDDNGNDPLIDVCYFIVGGSDAAMSTFDLHPLRHELIAVKELDREARPEYELIIRATEQCVPDEAQTKVEFDPDDDTLLKVRSRSHSYRVVIDPNPGFSLLQTLLGAMRNQPRLMYPT